MNASLIMLLAAAAGQLPACPPVAELSRTLPIALHIQSRTPEILSQWGVKLEPGDVLASTSYFVVDGVPTTFHVVRSGGVPGTTRLYAVCAAPWGELMCARDTFTSKGAAPDVFVRQQGKGTILVVRYQEDGRRRYEVQVLDQLTGLRRVCG